MDLVLDFLESNPVAICTAESCTGGQLAAALTARAGASAYYQWGAVTYSNAAKEQQLGVPKSLIESHGAVSEPVAKAMAIGALTHSKCQFAISTTGVAGPDGGSLEKPVGTVWFGLAWQDPQGQVAVAQRQQFAGDRADIQRQAVRHALTMLHDRLINSHD